MPEAAPAARAASPPRPVVLVVMGVSGSGKSTVAAALAQRLGWPEQEGDALHPPENIAKMAAGRPLTDEDRAPWLERVAAWIDEQLAAGRSGVITCSALRRRYRDVLRRPGVTFVYLEITEGLAAGRLSNRHGHFMAPALLGSQLDTLEPPAPDERAIAVSAAGTPDADVAAILAALDRAV